MKVLNNVLEKIGKLTLVLMKKIGTYLLHTFGFFIFLIPVMVLTYLYFRFFTEKDTSGPYFTVITENINGEISIICLIFLSGLWSYLVANWSSKKAHRYLSKRYGFEITKFDEDKIMNSSE